MRRSNKIAVTLKEVFAVSSMWVHPNAKLWVRHHSAKKRKCITLICSKESEVSLKSMTYWLNPLYYLWSIGPQQCSSTPSCPWLSVWHPPRSNWWLSIRQWRSASMSALAVLSFSFLEGSNQVPTLLCCHILFSSSFPYMNANKISLIDYVSNI